MRVASVLALTVFILVCGCEEDSECPTCSGNTRPTALFTVVPDTGTTATEFRFDASGSSDVEDSLAVLQVRWDWDSDGNWDTSYDEEKAASHWYKTIGTRNVNLEVRDTGGLTGTTTRSVTVIAFFSNRHPEQGLTKGNKGR